MGALKSGQRVAVLLHVEKYSDLYDPQAECFKRRDFVREFFRREDIYADIYYCVASKGKAGHKCQRKNTSRLFLQVNPEMIFLSSLPRRIQSTPCDILFNLSCPMSKPLREATCQSKAAFKTMMTLEYDSQKGYDFVFKVSEGDFQEQFESYISFLRQINF